MFSLNKDRFMAKCLESVTLLCETGREEGEFPIVVCRDTKRVQLGYPSQAQASAYSERFKERDLKKTIRPLKKQGDKHTLYIIYVYILKYEARASIDL